MRGWFAFGLMGVVCLSGCGDLSFAQPAMAQPAKAQAPAAPSPALEATQWTPLASSTPILSALAAGTVEAALTLAQAELLKNDASGRDDVLWLAARSARTLGQVDTALAYYKELGARKHPLATWAKLRTAELLVDRDPAAAKTIAATLRGPWSGQRQADVLYARALLGSGDTEGGITILRDALARVDATSPAVFAALPLANALSASPQVERRAEAVTLYRRIAMRLPGTKLADDANDRIKTVLATLPLKKRNELAQPSPTDTMALADTYFRARRYKDAENTYARAAKRLDEAGRCEALFMRGKSLMQRRERSQAATELLAVARAKTGVGARAKLKCTAPDLRARTLYSAGRVLSLLGRFPEAVAAYDEAIAADPQNTLADDSLYRAALAEREQQHGAEMVTRLTRVTTEYPNGDMAGEALFRLAWEARNNGDLNAALTHLDGAIARNDASREDTHGRANYWRARVLAAAGRRDEALFAYEQVALGWPLSFYAQLALARLDEMEPTRALSVRTAWGVAGTPASALPWRKEWETPAFNAAMALLRVGEDEMAMREFESAKAFGRGANTELAWNTIAVLSAKGKVSKAIASVRSDLGDFRRTPPLGRAQTQWRLAYPKAFAPLIEDAARTQSISPHFVRAIAREESSFEPTAVSLAQAYGLIQVILPTAKRWGAELGLKPTPTTLRDPAVNVPIGTRFIRYLWDRYAANPALVPAGYNAGTAAVDKWLHERGDRQLDEWIEEIPYDETRHYTRRVLQSYGVYHWLDGAGLPVLSQTLPSYVSLSAMPSAVVPPTPTANTENEATAGDLSVP